MQTTPHFHSAQNDKHIAYEILILSSWCIKLQAEVTQKSEHLGS